MARVLVVDDEEGLRSFLAEALGRHAVRSAADGEAVEQLRGVDAGEQAQRHPGGRVEVARAEGADIEQVPEREVGAAGIETGAGLQRGERHPVVGVMPHGEGRRAQRVAPRVAQAAPPGALSRRAGGAGGDGWLLPCRGPG